MVSLSEQPAQPESSEWPRAVHWLELYLPQMPYAGHHPNGAYSHSAGEKQTANAGSRGAANRLCRGDRHCRTEKPAIGAPVSFGEQVLLDVFQTLVTMGRPDMWIVQR